MKIANDNKSKTYDSTLGLVNSSKNPARYNAVTPYESETGINIAERMDSALRQNRKYKFNIMKENIEAVIVGNSDTEKGAFVVLKQSDVPKEIFTEIYDPELIIRDMSRGFLSLTFFAYRNGSLTKVTVYRKHLYDFKVLEGGVLPFDFGDIALTATYDWFDLATPTETYYIFGLTREMVFSGLTAVPYEIDVCDGMCDLGLQDAIYSNASIIGSEQILDNED